MLDRTTTAPWLPLADAPTPRHHPQPRPSTFAEIIGIEPRIGELLREAAALRSSRRVTWREYETYRRRAERLVGRHARRPELCSTEVHDLVMGRPVAALGV